jgi:hypothetical protein
MANPNIVNITSIFGNTAYMNVSTTTANIVQNATGTNTIYKINSINVANINANPYSVTVELNVNGSNTSVVKNVVVPANSALTVVGKDTTFYILENSSIQLTASANAALQAICSWEQIS